MFCVSLGPKLSLRSREKTKNFWFPPRRRWICYGEPKVVSEQTFYVFTCLLRSSFTTLKACSSSINLSYLLLTFSSSLLRFMACTHKRPKLYYNENPDRLYNHLIRTHYRISYSAKYGGTSWRDSPSMDGIATNQLNN